jgi:uncharacterized membrane protein
MPFCKNCGSNVEGQFCAKCGTPVAQAAAPAYPPPPAGQPYAAQPPQYPPPPAQSYQPPAGAYPPPPGAYPPPPGQQYPPAQPAAGGMTENVAGALCYVAGLITGIVFLALAPYNQNKFVRFHAFQSIFFNVAFVGLWIVDMVLGFFLPWGLHIILSLFGLVLWLGFMIVWILLMVKAYQNQKFKLPIIGQLAEQQA